MASARPRQKRRTRIPAGRTPSGLVRGDDAVTDWASIREWVLERDAHRCQICGIRDATDVDHIWPRRLGGTDHVDNLRAACGPCNKAKGDRVNTKAATLEQLTSAVRELDRRIEDLEAEKNDFLNEAFVRLYHDDGSVRLAAGDLAAMEVARIGHHIKEQERLLEGIADMAAIIAGTSDGMSQVNELPKAIRLTGVTWPTGTASVRQLSDGRRHLAWDISAAARHLAALDEFIAVKQREEDEAERLALDAQITRTTAASNEG